MYSSELPKRDFAVDFLYWCLTLNDVTHWELKIKVNKLYRIDLINFQEKKVFFF